MLKKRLQLIKSQDTNLYQHLVAVLRQLILSNDRDGYHMFEYYCQNVKSIASNAHEYRRQQFDELKNYIQKQTNILNKPSTGTQQQPVQVGPCGFIPNLTQQAKIFQKVGVGLGQQQTFLLFKSLQRFSILKQVKQLKFWGKITCSQKDYFIAESPAEAGQQGQLPPDVETKGTGVNKTTYWVANDLLEANWRQLPTITPQQLRISRKIKYLFSGNLDKKVFTNPFFPGTQAHLLKCQLVRISFTCNLVPKTMYNVNAEDKKEIQAAQQWKIPNFQFLTSLQNWVHFSQNLLNNGRTTWLKPEPAEGQEIDEQKVMKELQAKDPLQERLKPLSGDGSSAWVLKKVGDCNQYRAMTKNVEYVNNGYIHIKSLIWRGWHFVYHNKNWISIYIGNGNKYTGEWFYPREPQVVFTEANDRQQVQQPNFPPQIPKPQGEVQPIPNNDQ